MADRNFAVTVVAAVTVTVHVREGDLQPPPLHPWKLAVLLGVAVKVMTVPEAYVAEQVEPHWMPNGALLTVPGPEAAMVSIAMGIVGSWLNVAVTVTGTFPATVHVPVPEQPPPLQPANIEPVAVVEASVTAVVKVPVQVVPQLMPAGVLATVPAPVPASLTVTVNPLAAMVPHASLE